MDEGRTYKVSWSETGGVYHVKLSGRSAVEASATSLEDALDGLLDPILDAFGDGEPQFSLEPPIAHDPRLASIDLYHQLSSSGWLFVENVAELFGGGLCQTCGAVIGTRNDTPLRIGSLERPTSLVAWTGTSDLSHLPAATGYAASQKLLDQAPSAFLELFDQRPCEHPAGARRKFIELLPRAAKPIVGWRRLTYRPADPCPACGVERAPFREVPSPMGTTSAQFVSRRDAGADPGPFISWSRRPVWGIAVSAAWWTTHRHEAAWKGLFDDTWIGIVPEDEEQRVAGSSPWPIDH